MRKVSRRIAPGPVLVPATKPADRSPARAVPDGFVNRQDLVERLLASRDAALALITAPAGYGKSVLLAEWDRCDDRPFAWVSLDPCDDARLAITSAIARALEQTGSIDADAWPELMWSTAGDETSALRRLIAAAKRRGDGFVLVIDDAHTVAGTAVWAVVTALLGQLGGGAQLAVASRTEPPLAIGRLRAHRSLIELRTADLAMNAEQAASLLALAGVDSDTASTRALVELTEGWPVGLYLAALSVRGESDLPAALKRLSGDDHLIAEYFRDELLSRLSSDCWRFLTQVSVLDGLSGPVCDAVLERTASAKMLEELWRSNVMLTAVDRGHQHFRLHPLFKDALTAELRRAEPDLEPALHSRASDWLERHGDLDGAIGHAAAGGDLGRTGELLCANLAGLLAAGRNAEVRAWLGCFGPEQIEASAPLALAAAHSCLMRGEVDRARAWRLHAEAAAAAQQMPSLEGAEAIVEAMTAATSTDAMRAAAARACELEPEHSPWRPYGELLLGTALHLSGDRDGAAPTLERGVALACTHAPVIASLCLAQLAMLAIEQDDWVGAADAADRAGAVVEQAGLSGYPICALAFAARAAARAHEGRADEAKHDHRRATDLLAALGDFIPWYGAEARIMLARAALGLADTVKARTLLAEASRLARRTTGAVIFQGCFEQAWAHIDTLAESALSGPSSLTIAELRILRFLPSHQSFREIAERLDVSVNTVKTQAHAIYRKLDAASRSEAVAQATRAGLLGS
jgi:LuxR family transcriptional regulator, maltose regulon positive regulatory protein